MNSSQDSFSDQFYSRGIVETVREPLLILDEELCVRMANPSFYNTFDVSEEDIYGRSIYELGNGQWNIPELRKLLNNIIEKNSQFNDFEVTCNFPGLGKRTMLLNARRIVYHTDVQPLILLAIEDITQRIRDKEILRKYTDELERSNTELEQFASVASHDLQEPLRKIILFGDRLMSKYGDILQDEGIDYLKRMQNASKRMQNLINGLLTLSRITTRANPLITVDLNDILEHVLSDLEISVQNENASIEIDNLPEINADPIQIRLLFQNLISNAVKYHRENIPPEIRIKNETGRGENRIIIKDNGIGMDEKYLKKIFLPFQRLHGRNKYEGTGIGLTICKKIVERHGGKISVKSKPNEGSSFTITLPLKKRGDQYE